ncbi:MAG: BatD family protein [Candidatus Cloacimonadaceae bacterium]|jgi:hypothetical protein|nr:BatD family protein [Candidatus Cloacimonadota bacterium]MDY0127059.1 BatD family protein [Candidatus Cloacimonadaceae bacterium]MCB5255656.1 BatD family protein [Candidatus Cloacimonadota bacterium]MCK9178449.1 BatD family protein [Candidatus Cloacimonadota bacterium]MCK9242612.1 BatD family protein [Candidatus Cloacimonadota bacterium]
MKRYLFLTVMLLPMLLLAAVTVTASVNKTRLSLAERLEYTLEIKSDSSISVTEPSPPSIELFSFVNMRSSSRSSTTMSGFKVDTQHLRSYVYYYIPQKEGTTTIPAQEIRIGNKVYSSSEIVVTVVKSSSKSPAQSSPGLAPGFDFDDPDLPWSASRIAGSTTILAYPQRQKVYKGQPAVVSYYLYTDQMVRSFNLEGEKDYLGYGKSDYEAPTSLEYETVSHQGKRFQRALIKRLVLLPNETGELQAPVLQGRARIYEFGYLNQRVSSEPAWLEVLPLPKDGVPEDFGGAVGSFEVSEDLSAQSINLGEAITYSLRIAGQGNFNQFAHPQFPESSAQVSTPMAIDRVNAGVEGSRTLYYTIIPAQKGNYVLPSLSFSWFDPDRGVYRNFTGKKHEIQVKGASVVSYFSSLLESGKPQSIRPMLSRHSYPAYQSHLKQFWYWLIVAIILAFGIFSAYLAWQKSRGRRNPEVYNQMRADKALKKYLDEASEAARMLSQDFYTLAENGLLRYLAEKYGISNRLSIPEKIAELQQKQIAAKLIRDTEDFIELCEKQRFSPEKRNAADIMDDYHRLRQIVLAFSKRGAVK